MQQNDDPNRGRKNDPVEEAMAESFPASDPPAWTAARAGKPEPKGAKDARQPEASPPAPHCVAVGLFANEAAAQAAADELLAAGFNTVDIGPPRRHGNLGAGIGAAEDGDALGLSAALGALAAGAVMALFGPRGARYIAAAAAGGAVGAAAAHTAARVVQEMAAESGWPMNGTLVRVKVKTREDQERALRIIERQGARKLQVSWAAAC